jgi:competence protein ComEA
MNLRNLVAALAITLIGVAYAGEPVDINTADAKALATAIKGVGDKRAAAIVQYREEHGPFETIEDLAKVPGISAEMVKENQENLTVGVPAEEESEESEE